MAQNPMQRKMTNSFLLGMFITLLIAAIIVGLLLFRINKLNTQKHYRKYAKSALVFR